MLSATVRQLFRAPYLSALNGAVCCIAVRTKATKCAQILASSRRTEPNHFQSKSVPPDANRCIALLVSQQASINRSLNALEGWKSSSRVLTETMIDDLNQFCRFFKEYAEGIHFVMEEEMVFPTVRKYMKHSLIPYHHGMYLPSDHDTVRQYISRLQRDSTRHAQDSQGTIQAISELITFLRVHSRRTAVHLYPDIEAKVPENVLQELSSNCEQFMNEHKQKEAELLLVCDTLDRKYNESGWYTNNKVNGVNGHGAEFEKSMLMYCTYVVDVRCVDCIKCLIVHENM